jgi:hypothetical protein
MNFCRTKYIFSSTKAKQDGTELLHTRMRMAVDLTVQEEITTSHDNVRSLISAFVSNIYLFEWHLGSETLYCNREKNSLEILTICAF